MQNRYSGDIGDFSKLGVLRALHDVGLSIGLNWYLTPDESHNSDGRHTKYLDDEAYRACDPELWHELGPIGKSDDRRVSRLESKRILDATFFSDCLDFRDEDSGKPKRKPERDALRKEWYQRSLDMLAGLDVVCVDPDNGLLVSSAAGTFKENKFVLPRELAGYYARGSSVVCYQHKARKPDYAYARQFVDLLQGGLFPGASGFALKFEKTSQRYYLFIVRPEHRQAIESSMDAMLKTAWGSCFCLL
ncbi:MAG: hypothetical protein Q4B54_06340 [Coriobacteriales bacterium]|nr:hypothetical protein [Coriobacteriales bacterium]